MADFVAAADRRSVSEGSHQPVRIANLAAVDAYRANVACRSTSLALARPGSPARVPILAQMKATDAELAGRSDARTDELPSNRRPDPGGSVTTG